MEENCMKWSKPTWYRGILFRSRLEVKWASLFNKLKIRWEYEKQWFVIPKEWFNLPKNLEYKPDFYFPDFDTFFEAKGVMDHIDFMKITGLARLTGTNVVIGFNDYQAQMIYMESLEKKASEGPPDLTFRDDVVLVQCQKSKCKKRFFRPRFFMGDLCPYCGEAITNFKTAIRREFNRKGQYVKKKEKIQYPEKEIILDFDKYYLLDKEYKRFVDILNTYTNAKRSCDGNFYLNERRVFTKEELKVEYDKVLRIRKKANAPVSLEKIIKKINGR